MQVGTQSNVTGTGVYMSFFNITHDHHNKPSAVRIISLTPPGVDVNFAIRSISDEVCKMSTQGVIHLDAEGNERRLFLDILVL